MTEAWCPKCEEVTFGEDDGPRLPCGKCGDLVVTEAEGNRIARGYKKMEAKPGAVGLTTDPDLRSALRAECERQGIKPQRMKEWLFGDEGKDVN